MIIWYIYMIYIYDIYIYDILWYIMILYDIISIIYIYTILITKNKYSNSIFPLFVSQGLVLWRFASRQSTWVTWGGWFIGEKTSQQRDLTQYYGYSSKINVLHVCFKMQVLCQPWLLQKNRRWKPCLLLEILWSYHPPVTTPGLLENLPSMIFPAN